ncbi:hypothetical protein PFISCL1PPCAC_15970 [Pristionchus fissidentatus]|uniref:RING-type domain-containing protein n=1 Tax=Pristionchus fissidentatus TaxID=1538716 RepID=A0AAV5W2H2_9BILA|nr:hypothetical protein PFISCL1PPCAC_15970 [Pristionchus fissidentatus]
MENFDGVEEEEEDIDGEWNENPANYGGWNDGVIWNTSESGERRRGMEMREEDEEEDLIWMRDGDHLFSALEPHWNPNERGREMEDERVESEDEDSFPDMADDESVVDTSLDVSHVPNEHLLSYVERRLRSQSWDETEMFVGPEAGSLPRFVRVVNMEDGRVERIPITGREGERGEERRQLETIPVHVEDDDEFDFDSIHTMSDLEEEEEEENERTAEDDTSSVDVTATRNRIQEMREIDEMSDTISLRYSRNCGICYTENPRQRAAYTKCGHLSCLPCAEEHALSMGRAPLHCPFCRKCSQFIRLFEDTQ